MHEKFLNVFGKVNSKDNIKAYFSDAYVEKVQRAYRMYHKLYGE